MHISNRQLQALRDFICDYNLDDEWFLRHTDIEFEEVSHTVTLKIDNINEQEYFWLKKL